jgi:hypothetical protein
LEVEVQARELLTHVVTFWGRELGHSLCHMLLESGGGNMGGIACASVDRGNQISIVVSMAGTYMSGTLSVGCNAFDQWEPLRSAQ